MGGDVTVVDDRRVRVTHTQGLDVVVEQPRIMVPAGRRRVEVRYVIETASPGPGGRLRIETRPLARRMLSVLVVHHDGFGALSTRASGGGAWAVEIDVDPGQTRLLLVIDHPVGLPTDALPGILSDAYFSSPEPSLTRGAGQPRQKRAMSFPEGATARAAPGGPSWVDLGATRRSRGARDGGAAEALESSVPPAQNDMVLAEVGANMPSEAHLGDVVAVEVLLSREEVPTFAGTAHDEHVIVMNPEQPLHVTLLRRGFDLDHDADYPETGHRILELPPEGAPAARVLFWLRAAQEGEGEVQVVVRQDEPQPLATLRLTATVLPRTGTPLTRTAAQDALQQRVQTMRAPVLAAVNPFLNPRSLVIDENLVGAVSELSFDLVLPGFRRRFAHVIPDKTALLKHVFDNLDDAWRDIQGLEPSARRDAFDDRLRQLGSRLAREVLAPDLLECLRRYLDDIEELVVITSGETDIPWELVHLGRPGEGKDPEGRRFLGRAGLVRWVYNTSHPTDLSIRMGRGHYIVPAYAEAELALDEAQLEPEYLQPFAATPIDPPDATTIARLITSGEVDLLHFAGHGFSNDTEVPPVREIALAEYRTGVVLGADVDRSRIAFSLEDLRRSMPERPFAPPGPLVFLNACRVGQAPSTRSEVGGFAETFLRGGAGAFVGCLWSVGDRPAREFVAAFYRALDSGRTIAQATLAGRQAAREAGDISWLAYTVYAHPDARLKDRPPPPPPSTSSKGAPMTISSEAARKAPSLTVEELRTIHPFIVSTEDGRLAEGPATAPTSVEDFRTTRADIDDLFADRLPRFIEMHGTPVPMMLWAHGGLVGKASGLRIAHTQLSWWQANGVFPVHFVWRTGLAESLWDAVKDSLPGRPRGISDLFDDLIEAAVRAAPGRNVWSAMKRTAELSNKEDSGGAWYFAQKLADFMKDNPGSVKVHATGHSAGSIFHSHLLPEMLSAGVEEIASLSLLAPAIRVDEFKERILTQSVLERIGKLTTFTMTRAFEQDDTCLGIYRKSLLYLIRGALENEPDAEILGLQECLQRDGDLQTLLGKAGSGKKAEVIWSQTIGGGPRNSSRSASHGGFDNDAATMNSLARRVLGTDHLTVEFDQQGGARGAAQADPWPTEQQALDYISSRGAGTQQRRTKRALCIGIDQYPSVEDQLHGCVADASAWKQELEHVGFAVETLTDADATRQNIVAGIQDLIVRSRAGDVLVVHFSGHGTTVEDLDGDDRDEAERTGETRDEALCPVDFREGELLIDDDLGQLWDLLPDTVNLTVFFDSCHSGGAQRKVMDPEPAGPHRKSRLVRMTTENVEAYKAKRGGLQRATRSLDGERSVYFGACQATELAFESDGQGDFTRIALPRLREFLSGTNQHFYDAVLTAFGDVRKQTPVLLPSTLRSRAFLAPLTGSPETVALLSPPESAVVQVEETVTRGPSQREGAIVSILRGVADLIESS